MTARGPRSRGLLSAVAVAGLITGLCSACGSSSKSPSAAGTTGTTGAAGSTGSTSVASGVSGCPAAPGVTPTEVKVGVQSSQTGPEASYDGPFGPSAEAAIDVANQSGGVNGRKIVVVTSDDGSNPAQGLAAVEGLVQSNGVFAVLNGSSVAPTIFSYLTQNDIPDFDVLPDSPAFATSKNLFSAEGAWNTSTTQSTAGGEAAALLKQFGITTLANFAHAEPAGVAAAKQIDASVAEAGMKVVYENDAIPLQSFDATNIALRLKQLHPEAVVEPLGQAPSISIVRAMQQQGFFPKLILMDTGYDPGVFTAGLAPEANVYGDDAFVPYLGPINTLSAPAQAFRNGMAKYAPQVTGLGLYAAGGWADASLFLHALQLAGKCPTRSGIISNMRAVTSYNPGGLEAVAIRFAPGDTPDGNTENCANYVQINLATKSFVSPKAPTCA